MDPLDPDILYTVAVSRTRPKQGVTPPHGQSVLRPKAAKEKVAAERRLEVLRRTEIMLVIVAIGSVIVYFVHYVFRLWVVSALVFQWFAIVLLLAAAGCRVAAYCCERFPPDTRERCRTCKYDLTGLDEAARCPECGTEIEYPPDADMW